MLIWRKKGCFPLLHMLTVKGLLVRLSNNTTAAMNFHNGNKVLVHLTGCIVSNLSSSRRLLSLLPNLSEMCCPHHNVHIYRENRCSWWDRISHISSMYYISAEGVFSHPVLLVFHTFSCSQCCSLLSDLYHNTLQGFPIHVSHIRATTKLQPRLNITFYI